MIKGSWLLLLFSNINKRCLPISKIKRQLDIYNLAQILGQKQKTTYPPEFDE